MHETFFAATQSQVRKRDQVLAELRKAITAAETVRLDPLAPELSGLGVSPAPPERVVAHAEEGRFSGVLGVYRYQFEGEEDLLHLIVDRVDGSVLSAEEGQAVASLVLFEVDPGLIWIKPGRFSQHFYLGHELLLDSPS